MNMEFLSEEKRKKLIEFVKFCKKELNLKSVPKIQVQNGKKNIKTTANYDYNKEEKIIKVNAKNRAIVDVMRSIAHELVHHKQWEDGRLKVKPPDIGGVIEDEANAVAGVLIKKYSKIDNTIYDE